MTSRRPDIKTPDSDVATVTALAAVSDNESRPVIAPTGHKWRLTRVQTAALFAFTGFTVVLGAIESLAVRGQADFGVYELGLGGGWQYTVAVALEAGSLTFAGLALSRIPPVTAG